MVKPDPRLEALQLSGNLGLTFNIQPLDDFVFTLVNPEPTCPPFMDALSVALGDWMKFFSAFFLTMLAWLIGLTNVARAEQSEERPTYFYATIDGNTAQEQIDLALAQTGTSFLLLVLSDLSEITFDPSPFLPRMATLPILSRENRECRDPLLLAQMRQEVDRHLKTLFTITVWKQSLAKTVSLRAGAGILLMAVGYRFFVYQIWQRDPGATPVLTLIYEGAAKPSLNKLRNLATQLGRRVGGSRNLTTNENGPTSTGSNPLEK